MTPTRQTRPFLLLVAGVLIGAALVLAWASPLLQEFANDFRTSQPKLIVRITPSDADIDARLAAIPGVVQVHPATTYDMESMGLEPGIGWDQDRARTLVVAEGNTLDEVRSRALSTLGVDGAAIRTAEGVEWQLPGSFGGWVALDGWRESVFRAGTTTWLWTVLLLSGVALAFYGLGRRRPST